MSFSDSLRHCVEIGLKTDWAFKLGVQSSEYSQTHLLHIYKTALKNRDNRIYPQHAFNKWAGGQPEDWEAYCTELNIAWTSRPKVHLW